MTREQTQQDEIDRLRLEAAATTQTGKSKVQREGLLSSSWKGNLVQQSGASPEDVEAFKASQGAA